MIRYLPIAACFFASTAFAGEPLDLDATVQECSTTVEPSTLLTIIHKESSGNPYALNVNTEGTKPATGIDTKEAAIAEFQRLRSLNVNFDAGLGQINSGNLEWLGLDAALVFDPCENIKAASIVLTECYQRAASKDGVSEGDALKQAFSCYNTGNLRDGFRNGYVDGMLDVAKAKGYVVPSVAVLGHATPSEAVDSKPVHADQDNKNASMTGSREDGFSKTKEPLL